VGGGWQVGGHRGGEPGGELRRVGRQSLARRGVAGGDGVLEGLQAVHLQRAR
jgi:hypothetical protein